MEYKMTFRKSMTAVAVMFSLALVGCDGDDGRDGVDGINGADGANGAAGADAINGIALSPIGRVVLNAEGAA